MKKTLSVQFLSPPNIPMTLNKLNLALNNEFGKKNRLKAI